MPFVIMLLCFSVNFTLLRRALTQLCYCSKYPLAQISKIGTCLKAGANRANISTNMLVRFAMYLTTLRPTLDQHVDLSQNKNKNGGKTFWVTNVGEQCWPKCWLDLHQP